jgi:CHAD domain-containing protein
LRYAAEFFSELFAEKKAVKRQEKSTSALKQLQDGLGDLIAVDERLIASISPRNTAFAAGLLTGCEEARESEAMSAAIDGFTELAKAKPFWD